MAVDARRAPEARKNDFIAVAFCEDSATGATAGFFARGVDHGPGLLTMGFGDSRKANWSRREIAEDDDIILNDDDVVM